WLPPPETTERPPHSNWLGLHPGRHAHRAQMLQLATAIQRHRHMCTRGRQVQM
ncbi:uncharacterized protein EI90DRAFT_3031894, partial [Cantharellus anzutake]|uniref:uncharacterized protein n=1 Tax=Cantharellus anzutake TaxID=1750568 RepID=UPI001906E0B3